MFYRMFQKIVQSLCTTILQQYIAVMRFSVKSIQKEIVYTIKANVWIQQLSIVCFAHDKQTFSKQN